MDRVVKGMAEKEGVTEALKAKDQMAWVRAMNSIRSRAEEIVLRELVYGDGASLIRCKKCSRIPKVPCIFCKQYIVFVMSVSIFPNRQSFIFSSRG